MFKVHHIALNVLNIEKSKIGLEKLGICEK